VSSSLELRSIRLRVADLARSVEYYVRQLGFGVAEQSSNSVRLSPGPDATGTLHLEENRRAPRAPGDAAGLFHAALLLPRRAALGGWLKRAASRGVEFDGFSDHGVSDAIYLTDPDGNGLEFYADRPRETWPFANGELAMTTRSLDVPGLLAQAEPENELPLKGARWGHLHLRVTNLDRSEAFYRDALGMKVTQRSYPGARFLATDGYHHHLGLNTWGSPQHSQPAEALGLSEATFARRATAEPRQLRDPDQITIRVQSLVDAR
jgi:catechol 2,3-dioxygenase